MHYFVDSTAILCSKYRQLPASVYLRNPLLRNLTAARRDSCLDLPDSVEIGREIIYGPRVTEVKQYVVAFTAQCQRRGRGHANSNQLCLS